MTAAWLAAGTHVTCFQLENSKSIWRNVTAILQVPATDRGTNLTVPLLLPPCRILSCGLHPHPVVDWLIAHMPISTRHKSKVDMLADNFLHRFDVHDVLTAVV